jgi:hypothetical protein
MQLASRRMEAPSTVRRSPGSSRGLPAPQPRIASEVRREAMNAVVEGRKCRVQSNTAATSPDSKRPASSYSSLNHASSNESSLISIPRFRSISFRTSIGLAPGIGMNRHYHLPRRIFHFLAGLEPRFLPAVDIRGAEPGAASGGASSHRLPSFCVAFLREKNCAYNWRAGAQPRNSAASP